MKLQTSSSILIAIFLALNCAADAAEAPRWNVLFCFADDWGRYASCYAAVDGRPSLNQIVKTPNVDRLAREGVLFRNAFVNAPSCTPCQLAALRPLFLQLRPRRNPAGSNLGQRDSKLSVALERRRLSNRQELQSLEPWYAG